MQNGTLVSMTNSMAGGLNAALVSELPTERAGEASPLTVVCFDHTALMSGGEIALLHLLLHLDTACFHPVVVLGAEGPLHARLTEAGIETHLLLLDHDGIPASPEPPTAARSASGPSIGLVGRLSAWKGQHIFLEAAALVHKRFPRARFQIIGSAMFGEEAYEAEIRQLCVTLGLEECVEFTGFRTDVPALIAQLDILVHASTTGEPFGQVVVEGMMAGKPVVATDGGGVPEIVEDGVTGWLAPMGESAPMAEAILRLLEDPEEAAAMGAAGRQRVLEHFTIELTARRVQEVYEQFWPGHGAVASP